MDTVINLIPQWDSWLALLLYWLPLALCAYGYLIRSVKLYRTDLASRAKHEAGSTGWYAPSQTFGSLVGRAILTVTPVANLFAAVFDVAPEVFGDFFAWIGKALNVPLVPGRQKPEPRA